MELLACMFGVLVGVLGGVVIGIWIGMERMRKAIETRSLGWLRIDRSEPDEPPRPFLELRGASIETVAQEKFVILEVVNDNYLSPN